MALHGALWEHLRSPPSGMGVSVTDALTKHLNVVKVITESSAVSLGFWRKPSHGREPDGVTSCYSILQDGGANRWQVNTGWYGKMQKVSMYPSGPMNDQNLQLRRHIYTR